MTFVDRVSLVLHVLAAMGLVGAGIVQVMAGARLRSSASTESIVQWAKFARSAGPLLIGSAVLSLATGGHMAGAVWTSEAASGFSYPFITLGALALVFLAPIGPMVGGVKLKRLVVDALSPEADTKLLASRAKSADLWGPIHSLVGVGVGLVIVMSAKPESWASTALILVATFALGWLSGLFVSRQRTH